MAITLNQFHAMSTGTYNAGMLVVNKDSTKLDMVNNHVKLTFLNNKKIDADTIIRTKNAFMQALSNTNKLSEGQLDAIRERLDLPSNTNDLTKFEKDMLRPLSREDVRSILSDYCYDLTVAKPDGQEEIVFTDAKEFFDPEKTQANREIGRQVNLQTTNRLYGEDKAVPSEVKTHSSEAKTLPTEEKPISRKQYASDILTKGLPKTPEDFNAAQAKRLKAVILYKLMNSPDEKPEDLFKLSEDYLRKTDEALFPYAIRDFETYLTENESSVKGYDDLEDYFASKKANDLDDSVDSMNDSMNDDDDDEIAWGRR